MPDSPGQQSNDRKEKVITMAENEWNMLKRLDHPNIVRVIDVYKDSANFYIVTDFIEGVELFDEICKREYFTEEDAKGIS
jgi:calcium-dependent protein kinase